MNIVTVVQYLKLIVIMEDGAERASTCLRQIAMKAALYLVDEVVTFRACLRT